MRRLIVFAGAVAGLACANLAQPPGGPPRKVAPELVSVTPESGAVNVKDKNAVFSFDVIVDDRSGRGGKLENTFIVSPGTGTVVNWRRDRIDVRPKGGFRPATAYSIIMLPGIADLNHNAVKEARVLEFSTGPKIPPYSIHGRVFDWMTERIVADARVDITRLPDSLPYVGISDTSGQFRVGPLDTGTYLVRVLLDNNKNGLRDLNEPWDSTRVTVKAESPFVELRAATRDSFPPRLLAVAPTDSITLNASFDRALDPATPLTPALFRVQRADSSVVPIARVYTQAQYTRLRLQRDSVLNAARRDSIAKADTSRRATNAPATMPANVGPVVPPAVQVKPSVPPPAREAVIVLDSTARLEPLATYRITAIGVRSLTGASRSSDRIVTIPRRDSTKATPPKAP